METYQGHTGTLPPSRPIERASHASHDEGVQRRVLAGSATVVATGSRLLTDAAQVVVEATMPGQNLRHTERQDAETQVQPLIQEWEDRPGGTLTDVSR